MGLTVSSCITRDSVRLFNEIFKIFIYMSVEIPAVVPVAGLGTRMLPMSMAIPKEMIPLPVSYRGRIKLVPILHLIYLKLFQAGVTTFYLVISRDKEAIIKYFTPDWEYIERLENIYGKYEEAELLRKLYDTLAKTHIEFIYQEEARGFGPAVYQAREYIESDFIIHPGDDYIIDDEGSNYISRLISYRERFNADVILYVERVDDPRHYGVIKGDEIEEGIYLVTDLVEKPKKPPSDLAITAIYLIDREVLSVMEGLSNKRRSWELVDAVQILLKRGKKVIAVEIENKRRVDVGRPEEYLNSISKCIEMGLRM